MSRGRPANRPISTAAPAGAYRIPINPELSAKQHAKSVSESMVVACHTIDLYKFWLNLASKYPVKFAEMMLSRFPDMVQQQGADIAIHVHAINVPQVPTPGVLASPVTEHVAPTASLKLIVGGAPAEVIEAE